MEEFEADAYQFFYEAWSAPDGFFYKIRHTDPDPVELKSIVMIIQKLAKHKKMSKVPIDLKTVRLVWFMPGCMFNFYMLRRHEMKDMSDEYERLWVCGIQDLQDAISELLGYP